MSRFFITTPIFYVNAAPHIGHCHTLVLADALNRLQRLRHPREKTLFSTGSDEHGIKIQRAAQAAGKTEGSFCNTISAKFRALCDLVGSSHDNFIRTTDLQHKECVASFWQTLSARGHIYKGSYEGWYSISDENFVTDIKEVDVNGKKVTVSTETGNPVEWIKEENYMFRLSNFRGDLLHWLDTNPDVVQPNKFHALLRHWVELGFGDLSVSRGSGRVNWAIPVPDDPAQSIYVWLDALVNYLTVANAETGGQPLRVWPPTVHVIGKDILKFHGIYWPAFLMAAGLDLPKRILCHSHWTVDEQKMSKSRGNVVCPFETASRVTPDGLRYFLLREATPHSDANFSEVKITRVLNNDLANTFGNLLGRCTAIKINQSQIIPRFPDISTPFADDARRLLEAALSLPAKVEPHFLVGDFYIGIQHIQALLRDANSFVQTTEPWKLAKVAATVNNSLSVASAEGGTVDAGTATAARHQLDAMLHTALEVLRVAGILLQPIIPGISERLLNKLMVEDRTWSAASLRRNEDVSLGCATSGSNTTQASGQTQEPLFTRLKEISN